MAGASENVPHERAVETLQQLDLTEYQARCFVALVRVSSATAKEVSRISDVPYTRVYNTVEDLQDRGLVEVQESDPREFRAIPADDAIRALRDEYESRLETAEQTLSELETADEARYPGTWEIADRGQVTRRATEIVNDAEEEVVFVGTDDRLFETELLQTLADVPDEVSVVVGVSGEEIREQVEQTVPEATVVDWRTGQDDDWTLGRILMVDRSTTMLSSLQGSDLPGVRDESAVWAEGDEHCLVTGVTNMLVTLLDTRGIYE